MANLNGLDIEELLESGQRAAAQASKKNGADSDGDTKMRNDGRLKEDDDFDGRSANGDRRSRRLSDASGDGKRASRRERFGGAHDDSSPRSGRHGSYDSDRRGSYDRRGGRLTRSRSPGRDYYRPSGGRDRDRDRDRHARDRDYRRDRDRDYRRRSTERSYRGRHDRGDSSPDARHERPERYPSGRAARTERGDRDSRPDRGTRERSPKRNDDEKDRCTVFIAQLAARAKERHVKDFFSKVGEVSETKIVTDKISGRNKGIGYVTFANEESVQKALALTGHKICDQPIIVSLTEAEKNRQARANEGQPTPSNGIPYYRLYVGNIHFDVGEAELEDIFGAFGELEFVSLHREENGRSKGYGFVQFKNPADAKQALAELNGFELLGRCLRVGLGNDKFTPETTANLMKRFPDKAQDDQQNASFSGSGGRGTHAGGTDNFDRSARDKQIGHNSTALDDSDIAGVNFNNVSRDSLMKKLARIEDTPKTNAPSGAQAAGGASSASRARAAPSRCIVVKNAFRESDKQGTNWAKEIEDDFRGVCAKSYGEVVFVGVPSDSQEGEVYVKFKDATGGDNAFKGLNGRYFAGNVLTAQPVVDAIFNMNFPKSAHL